MMWKSLPLFAKGLASWAVLCGVPFFAVSCASGVSEPGDDPVDLVERGRYLVTVGGCHDCHTPFAPGPEGPAPDMTRALSGHPQDMELPPPPAPSGPWIWSGAATNTAFAGPWGISYAINLTPDEFSGIGTWTEDIFISTLRTGRHWGVSRPILPPMPWQNIREMTDEDLRALYAYLRTVPPIDNLAPEAVIAEAPATE